MFGLCLARRRMTGDSPLAARFSIAKSKVKVLCSSPYYFGNIYKGG
jgi:hypothetical protein